MRLACVVVGLLLSSTAAHAVSITNRDDHDHKVTIIEGDTKTDHVLKPSQVLTGVCTKGCTVRLNDDEDDEYELAANDVVSIEEDSLYYDNPDTPAPGNGPQVGAKKLDIRFLCADRPANPGGGAFCFRPAQELRQRRPWG